MPWQGGVSVGIGDPRVDGKDMDPELYAGTVHVHTYIYSKYTYII